MTISLENIGKRFNFDWVFRKLDFTFTLENRYAILGPNGSGKSTLLQIIAGSQHYSEGKINYTLDSKIEDSSHIFKHISFAAPYLELVEEYTLAECLRFHCRFKPFLKSVSIDEIAASVHLENALHKQIRYYSSGMKQRAKLAQAIFSDTPLLLLDEPCTNLDDAGVSIYHQLIQKYTAGRIVIVSSNDSKEYDFCNQYLHITAYKNNA